MAGKIIERKTIPNGLMDAICPPLDKVWKITSIFAPGPSFYVAFGDRHTYTDLVPNYTNLSCQTFINDSTFIIFKNMSGGSKIGFCCGEEVDP